MFALIAAALLSANHKAPPTTITVEIKFSESSLDSTFFSKGTGYPYGYVFGVDWYTCQSSQHNCKQNDCHDEPECPGGNAIYQNEYMVHNANDKVGSDTWHKKLVVDGGFTGDVSIDIFAPLPLEVGPDGIGFSSSVTWCATKWRNEMGGELCMANGAMWTVHVDGSGDPITLTVYPGFGMGVGETSEMFPAMYSPQLNNSRKVPVYVPSTVLQNKVKRPVDIMVILDGSEEVVQKFSTLGGFESAQSAGFVPESIIIGIQTIQFVLEGLPQTMGTQRGYELAWEVPLGDGSPDDKSQSCIPGPAGGGSDLMLAWVDEVVIPLVLGKLGDEGMERGDVAISGGSQGGLTSCYAASARPDVFNRAACFSPSNCFNHGLEDVSALSKAIVSNFAKTGKLPKAVIAYQGAEVYGEDQMKYMMQEDDAWQSIGMQPLDRSLAKHPADPSIHQTYDFYTATTAPDHMIMSIQKPGGQHTPSTWMLEFHDSLINLYRPDRRDKNRKPRLDQNKYFSAKLANPPSPNLVTVEALDSNVASQFDYQNTVSNARFDAMEEANKVMADKIDALTAMLGSIPPMIAECTAARRARAAAAAGTGGEGDGDDEGGGGGDNNDDGDNGNRLSSTTDAAVPATTTTATTAATTTTSNNSNNSSMPVIPAADGSGSKGGRVAGTVIGVLIAIAMVVGIVVLYTRGSFDTLCDKFGRGGGNDAYKRAAAHTGISSPAGAGARGVRLNTAAVANASYQANYQAEALHSTA